MGVSFCLVSRILTQISNAANKSASTTSTHHTFNSKLRKAAMALPTKWSTVFSVLSQSTFLIQSITKDSKTPPITVVPIPRTHGFFINFFIHFTSFQPFTHRQAVAYPMQHQVVLCFWLSLSAFCFSKQQLTKACPICVNSIRYFFMLILLSASNTLPKALYNQ